MLYKKSIIPYIKNLIPNHILDSNSLLPDFLEAYYAWLNQPQNMQYVAYSLENLANIDESIDEFTDEFVEEYLSMLTEHTIVDKALIIKHLSSLYKAKGSVPSYKLLFRLLYGKNVEIFFPREQMLIASDGKWIQNIVMFVNSVSGNMLELEGREAVINTGTVPIKVVVERVELLSGSVYKVYINKDFFGTISISDTIQLGNTYGVILPTTSRVSIETPGLGFSVGQVFNITTSSGSGSAIKVLEVGDLGELVRVQLVKFGTGYTTNFSTDLTSATSQSEDTVVISLPNVTIDDFTTGFIDSGYMNTHDYYEIGYGDGSYVGDTLATFYTDSAAASDPNKGVVTFTLGALGRFPGFYSSNDGFLSDTIYLQDSYYYQVYSYVIRIDQELDTYKEIVKNILHPAGLAMFGEYQLTHDIDFSLDIDVTVE